MLKKLKLNGSMMTYKTENYHQKKKKDVLSITRHWNAKEEVKRYSETGKFGLGIQNEARQKLTEFCQENMLAIANTLFQQHGRQL